MFDVNKIQTGLLGLVGIRQPSDPDYAFLDAANTTSDSALFLDDISNFKVQFYKDTQDYVGASDAELNTDLQNIQKAAIVSVCQQVFGSDSYIDKNFIYTEATNRVDVETTIQNGFVGFRIIPDANKDVAFKITRVRLEFQGTGDIKLVLFNSNLNDPIYEQIITIASNTQLETLDWVVNSTNDDYKGEYYLGYQYDGTLIPFKRNYRYSNSRNYIKNLCIEPYISIGSDDVTMFDIDHAEFLSENTGLNPDITVYNDYTDLILENKFLFAKAIQLQYAILVMQKYVSTTRSNNIERLSKETILRTIETIEGSTRQSPIRVTGLNKYLGDEVEMLMKTIEQLKKGYFGSGIQVITAH